MTEKQASRMDATKWVVVVMAAVIVLLLALLSQRQAAPKADPAPAPAPSASAATPTADPSAEAARAEFLLALPRREASDPLALGAVDAPVVLTEWADYRCPFCSVWAEETLPQLRPLIDDGTLRVEFRDLAIFGDESIKAATAARAAGEQGAYFAFQHALFVALPNQGHPDIPDDLVHDIVTDLGLDLDRFTKDWADPAHAEAVQADSAEAQQLGLTSTPAFVIGTEFLAGAQPLEVFQQVIAEQAALLS
ncbi:MAG TPA: thioredoxin domain-containing protein [Arachnia sp.]|nr:thioredoxin domain-containing protein [Arachnia sp.]